MILGCAQCWGTYLGPCGAVVAPVALHDVTTRLLTYLLRFRVQRATRPVSDHAPHWCLVLTATVRLESLGSLELGCW